MLQGYQIKDFGSIQKLKGLDNFITTNWSDILRSDLIQTQIGLNASL